MTLRKRPRTLGLAAGLTVGLTAWINPPGVAQPPMGPVLRSNADRPARVVAPEGPPIAFSAAPSPAPTPAPAASIPPPTFAGSSSPAFNPPPYPSPYASAFPYAAQPPAGVMPAAYAPPAQAANLYPVSPVPAVAQPAASASATPAAQPQPGGTSPAYPVAAAGSVPQLGGYPAPYYPAYPNMAPLPYPAVVPQVAMPQAPPPPPTKPMPQMPIFANPQGGGSGSGRAGGMVYDPATGTWRPSPFAVLNPTGPAGGAAGTGSLLGGLRDRVLGWPEKFVEPPLGAASNEFIELQRSKALEGKYTLYRSDFVSGTDRLSPGGANRLNRMATRLNRWMGPLTIEWVPEDPAIGEARRNRIVSLLQGAGFNIAPEQVVVGPSPYEGLRGEEGVGHYNAIINRYTQGLDSFQSNIAGGEALQTTGGGS
ncbi:hypothetical protein Isop_0073 [Isosphaera pallida ATCC 43644]|uniref:Uncharacterized protein n=1 Tax=Isosphaera pallida (strain ATCC 43644 / DSM 9630 / IS1B) TaxID=575540 RepID=E8R5C9_ISOPI|nr:hypothetical protein [Isosphaera pallida]ADV60670.1 hypothetical protein Isop_0073 [Isosphaera pallida ATCC 43644]